MRLAMIKDRHHAAADRSLDDKAARLAVLDRGADAAAAPWTPAASEHPATDWEPTTIVRLPVAPGRDPGAPGVIVDADLRIRRFHDGAVEEERYTAALRPSGAAPAAMLAALADAAPQIEGLAQDGSPDDHLVLTVVIRR